MPPFHFVQLKYLKKPPAQGLDYSGLPLLLNTQQPQALEPSSLDQPVAGTEIFPFLDASRDFFIVHILKTLSLGMGFWTRVCSCPSGATCALWVVCALEISALEHGGGVESITGLGSPLQ